MVTVWERVDTAQSYSPRYKTEYKNENAHPGMESADIVADSCYRRCRNALSVKAQRESAVLTDAGEAWDGEVSQS